MRAVRFRVARQLIEQALGFPPEAKLLLVEDDRDAAGRIYIFYVAAPGLPNVPEGQLPPFIEPTMRTAYAMTLESWNVEKSEDTL